MLRGFLINQCVFSVGYFVPRFIIYSSLSVNPNFVKGNLK